MLRGLVPYAIAAGLTGAATLVVVILNAQLARGFFSVLMIAVMLSAWLGGLGPGLLASLLSALVINYFFQQPRYEFQIATLGDAVQLAVFTVAAVLLSAMTRSRNRARQDAQEALQRALHDPLTALPNRVLLLDRIDQAVRTAHRDRLSLAVMVLDLDGFKRVNDQHGHHTGDAVLCEAASRLRDAVRESDTVARLGGDEFAIVLPPPVSPDGALLSAEKLLATLAEPFVIQGHSSAVSGSIGIACYPKDGLEAETLLRAADAAMYLAKQNGLGYSVAVAADAKAVPVTA